MSLVSRPWRYAARSAPDTTIRPRSNRSRRAARSRAARYASVENMVLCCTGLMRHSIRAIALAAAAAALSIVALAQSPSNEPVRFLTFIGGRPVGNDTVLVARSARGWTITSTGSVGPPLDLVTRTLQIRYDPDWKPL